MGVVILKTTALVCAFSFAASYAYADGISSRVNWRSADGTVNTYPYQAKFTNGVIADNGDGTINVAIAGSSAIINQSTLQAGATAYPDFVYAGTSGTVNGNFAVQKIFSVGGGLGAGGNAFINGGNTLTTGSFNFMFGSSGNGAAGPNINASGSTNTCVGAAACHAITSDVNTIAVGYESLFVANGTSNDTALGELSMANTTSGSQNTGIGRASLFRNITGSFNTAMGYNACLNTTADTALNNIICIGSTSKLNTSGTMAIGSVAQPITDVYMNSINPGDTVNGNSIEFHAQASSGTNATGGSFTIDAGQGSGNGKSGSINFQVAPPNGTGDQLNLLLAAQSITAFAHIVSSGPTPAVGTCGVSPSIIGNDNSGTITVGSGLATACTLTFANSWGATPSCVISDNSTAVTGDISSISATAVTFGFSATLGGGQIYYLCTCQGPSCT